MLYSFDSGRYVEKLPHKAQFDAWRKKLSDSAFEAVRNELMTHFNENEVNTAGWIPGHDWTGTVYDPLYRACGNNVEAAGLFFGLIVFKLLMDDPDKVWGFGRYEINNIPIKSLTYFLVQNPPSR